jgi:hypothetical protein
MAVELECDRYASRTIRWTKTPRNYVRLDDKRRNPGRRQAVHRLKLMGADAIRLDCQFCISSAVLSTAQPPLLKAIFASRRGA